MTLIKHTRVVYAVEVAEADVRKALTEEALERHGLMHEGKPVPGCTTSVTFDGRRGGGTYTVRIDRDLSKSGQAQLPKPEGRT